MRKKFGWKSRPSKRDSLLRAQAVALGAGSQFPKTPSAAETNHLSLVWAKTTGAAWNCMRRLMWLIDSTTVLDNSVL